LLPTLGRIAPRYCDIDGKTDGACTFALPRCGQLGCGAGEFITVLTAYRRIVRVRSFGGVTTYSLHCRRPLPCDDAHRCTAVTRTCVDGIPGTMQEGQCDLDQQVSDACLFGFFCSNVCGSQPVDDVEVPVGESRIVQSPKDSQDGVSRYTLHCLPGSPLP
jgi:hypothetical protein